MFGAGKYLFISLWVEKTNCSHWISSEHGTVSKHWYYKDRANVYIVRAFLKYGLGNFALLILEFSDKDAREQYWIDELKPDYNIY